MFGRGKKENVNVNGIKCLIGGALMGAAASAVVKQLLSPMSQRNGFAEAKATSSKSSPIHPESSGMRNTMKGSENLLYNHKEKKPFLREKTNELLYATQNRNSGKVFANNKIKETHLNISFDNNNIYDEVLENNFMYNNTAHSECKDKKILNNMEENECLATISKINTDSCNKDQDVENCSNVAICNTVNSDYRLLSTVSDYEKPEEHEENLNLHSLSFEGLNEISLLSSTKR